MTSSVPTDILPLPTAQVHILLALVTGDKHDSLVKTRFEEVPAI